MIWYNTKMSEYLGVNAILGRAMEARGKENE